MELTIAFTLGALTGALLEGAVIVVLLWRWSKVLPYEPPQ
jgi:hypothetical protein